MRTARLLQLTDYMRLGRAALQWEQPMEVDCIGTFTRVTIVVAYTHTLWST